MKDKWSVKRVLPLLFLGSGLLLIAVYLGISYGYQKSQHQQWSKKRLELMAPRLVFITQRLLGSNQGDVLDMEMLSMQGLQHIGLVAVVDNEQQVLHSSNPFLRGVALESTELGKAADMIAAADAAGNGAISWLSDRKQMLGVFPYILPAADSASESRIAGYIAISLKLDESYAELQRSIVSQAVIFSILLGIVAGMLWYVLHRMLTVPLRRIVDATRSNARGDYSVRTGIATRNELGEISSTLDALAESSLKQADVESSNRRLSEMVEDMVDEVYVNDATTFETVNTNKAARKNLGYSAAELARLKPWDYVQMPGRAAMVEFLQPLFDGSLGHIECESLHLRKDGSSYPVRARMQYMSHQTPPVLVTISQDLSTQKEQEEAATLRDRALAVVSDGIVISDANPDKRCMVYVNQAICDMSGFSADELLGESIDVLRKGKLDQPALQKVNEARRKGESVHVQLDATRKDGSNYVTEVSLSPLFNANGELTHYIGISRDITQKLQTDEKLHQAQKIKAIGDLSGGLAHDFNNLLSVIVGNLELLRATTDDEAQIARIDGAENAAHMGAHLTHRLLSFASQQRLAPVITNVNEQVHNAMTLLASTIGESISLSEELAPDLWNTLTDPGEIETAVINLTINARDAMQQGGTITVRTANISQQDDEMARRLGVEPGDYVRICVMDNGPGISESLQGRIFEPFFTTKKDSDGSGLGLASVFGFAKQCGGGVSVSSAEGEGTVVSVYLPRHRQVSEGPQENPQDSGDHSRCFDGASVLVVEDKEMVRKLTVQQLETLGFRTQEVEDGVKAIALLESGVEVDVVLSDVIMPGGVCGYDVARWVQANRPDCRILMSSGFNQPADWGGEVELSNLPVLQKPYRLDDLRKALQDVMDCNEVEPA